jgi:hypothetical protein
MDGPLLAFQYHSRASTREPCLVLGDGYLPLARERRDLLLQLPAVSRAPRGRHLSVLDGLRVMSLASVCFMLLTPA